MEKLRIWLWPRRSWFRSTQYVQKRILRITASPHAIAAGVAAGVFTSFTPFMGLHFIVALVLAFILRGNMIASALGTFFGNPLSFPIIWAATFSTGNFLLGNSAAQAGELAIGQAMRDILSACWNGDMSLAMAGLSEIWTPLLYPMLVGGSVLGLLFAVPAYFITKRGTMIFRERRRNRLISKASAIKEKARNIVEQQGLAGKAGQT